MLNKIFKSEKYLGHNKKNYFEGWYFRHTGDNPFSFIVGISKSVNDTHSFIQYIDENRSHYFRYNADEFTFDEIGMTVNVGGNDFSLAGIDADIDKDGVVISAHIRYANMEKFVKTAYAPSVMGPFSYVPMYCNHAVISMNHDCAGSIVITEYANDTRNSGHDASVELLVNCAGYIEKDYGSKFPQSYFWMHASNADTSIMCAVAWPIIGKMRGYLCIIRHNGKQYNLSLYNGGKLELFEIDSDNAELILSRGKNRLYISAHSNDSRRELIAPDNNGEMTIRITENLAADSHIRLVLDGEDVDLSNIGKCAFESVLK